MLRPNKRKFSVEDDAEVSQTPLEVRQSNIPAGGHQTLQSSQINIEAASSVPDIPSQQADRHIQKLKDEIRSVYGPNSTVYVTVLPTPEASPQKKKFRADSADLAPFPPHFFDTGVPGSSFTGEQNLSFGSAKSDSELDYESSYTSSEPFSPASSSPLMVMSRSNSTILDHIPEELSPTDLSMQSFCAFNDADPVWAKSPSLATRTPRRRSADLELASCIEYTGVSEEEVQAYISEQNSETNRWSCLFPECDKTFGRRENIKSHVQTHLGDRQYKCRNCTKRFVRQHDLKRHAKIHTGDKPYECPCGAGFARQDALTRHRQRGVCVGGFPNVIRRQARRGRPRKKRTEDELQAVNHEIRNQTAVAPKRGCSVSSVVDYRQSYRYNDYPQTKCEENENLLSSYQVVYDKTLNTPTDFSTFLSTPCHNQPIETTAIIQNPATSVRDSCASTHSSTATSAFALTSDTIAQTPPISPLSQQHSLDAGEEGNQKHHSFFTEPAVPELANPFTTPPHSPLQSDKGIRAAQDLTLVHSANGDGPGDSHLANMLCDPINLLSDEQSFLVEESCLRSEIDWMIRM